MTVKLQSEVFRKEEKYKDLVYQQLDAMVEYADGDEKRQQKYVLSGAFEDQDAFAAHSAPCGQKEAICRAAACCSL